MNPQYPIIAPSGTWTKIATNVTFGLIHLMGRSSGGIYLQTYRVTGDPAPTPSDYSEGVRMFIEHAAVEEISSPESIDVYVFSVNEQGTFRLDV